MKSFFDPSLDPLLSKLLAGTLGDSEKKTILAKLSEDPAFRENFGSWIQSLRTQWNDIGIGENKYDFATKGIKRGGLKN
jgi:hypothetical protein